MEQAGMGNGVAWVPGHIVVYRKGALALRFAIAVPVVAAGRITQTSIILLRMA